MILSKIYASPENQEHTQHDLHGTPGRDVFSTKKNVRTIAKDMKFKNGPKNNAVGLTHASVSAIIIVLLEVSLTKPTVSTTTCGSMTIIFRLVTDAVAVAVVVDDDCDHDVGAAKR